MEPCFVFSLYKGLSVYTQFMNEKILFYCSRGRIGFFLIQARRRRTLRFRHFIGTALSVATAQADEGHENEDQPTRGATLPSERRGTSTKTGIDADSLVRHRIRPTGRETTRRGTTIHCVKAHPEYQYFRISIGRRCVVVGRQRKPN